MQYRNRPYRKLAHHHALKGLPLKSPRCASLQIRVRLLRFRIPGLPDPYRQDQRSGKKQRHDHEDHAGGERTCAVAQVTHEIGPHEPSQASHRVDEANRRGGGRFAQESGRDRPEAGHESHRASARQDQKYEAGPEMSAQAHGNGHENSTQSEDCGRMPAAFSGAIGIPAIPEHYKNAQQVGQRRDQRDAQIRQAGRTLEDRRKPEVKSVEPDQGEKIDQGQQNYFPLS